MSLPMKLNSSGRSKKKTKMNSKTPLWLFLHKHRPHIIDLFQILLFIMSRKHK